MTTRLNDAQSGLRDASGKNTKKARATELTRPVVYSWLRSDTAFPDWPAVQCYGALIFLGIFQLVFRQRMPEYQPLFLDPHHASIQEHF
jgi:hypothetical protein